MAVTASTGPTNARPPIARPGDTCWRREPAGRAAFLIDGAAYFRALRSALTQAEHSILLLGWELHTRVALDPEAPAKATTGDPAVDAAHDMAPDGWPVRLCDLLYELAERRPALEIHVLVWDFAMIYLLEREVLPVFRLPWRLHPRIHYHMDNHHPTGGSHHQKIVVIDDRLAFCGGLDVTAGRWDTPEHKARDPRRRRPDGERYGPFHDVQMAVDGPAAAALGALARERWFRATGTRPAPPPATAAPPWPEGLRPDLTDITVAIARTEPAHEGRPEVREVERLHLAGVAAAEQFIYFESQYFTSAAIGNAIAASLARPDGPEIVLVMPHNASGWLQETVMGVGRARLLRRLRAADRHGRLAVYYPVVPGARYDAVKVHAKVTVIDDRAARIGSANLCNRSMGLDTECDLMIEAEGDPAAARTIAGLRDRLLAEHLGAAPHDVAAAITRHGALIPAIEALRGNPRTLVPLTHDVPEALDRLVPNTALVDPERPIDAGVLTARLLGENQADAREIAAGRGRISASRRLLRLAVVPLALAALAAAWALTPLHDLTGIGAALDWAAGWRDSPAAPAYVLAAFVAGGLIAFPVTVLVSLAGILFGSLGGFVLGLAGSLLSASVLYLIGRAAGREAVRRLGGRAVNEVSRRIGRRGAVTVAFIRLVPIAPFSLVNLVAGASHIGFRDFLLGTLLGMAPGIFVIAVFGDRLEEALRSPDAASIALMFGAALLVAGLAMATRSWILRRRQRAAR
jgi:phosphatidylserine/phosphatidylglycerophosphate/cardiolipin synthase-like enzyme/uncharacterized membrane protein YdjX (TVP38/TMEM64 family)